MAVRIYSACTIGAGTQIIEVEVDLTAGLSQFIIVGLAGASVQEAKERIRFAVKNSGFHFPRQRKVINLAPAHTRKSGSLFDLPMAVGILCASGQLDEREAGKYLFIGEVSLDGKIKSVRGILPIVYAAKKAGFEKIVVPIANRREALLVSGIAVYSVDDLKQVTDLINCRSRLKPEYGINFCDSFSDLEEVDLSDIKGQFHAKRALEVAVAGGHNILFCGSPGCGKTMLASRLGLILPPLGADESLEVTSLHSIAGNIDIDDPLIRRAPLRKIHHSASLTSLIGGGNYPKPGEVTLAHRGILLLDEVAEFPRKILDSLRQPLEDREIVISRNKLRAKFPCSFMLAATMNPCECGYAGTERCGCSPGRIERYQKSISGAIIDRIDLVVFMEALSANELVSSSSKKIISVKKLALTRKRQKDRQGKLNSELSHIETVDYCSVKSMDRNVVAGAISTMKLSARGYDRILRVSRTLADLDEVDDVQEKHFFEALQYRSNINSDP